MNIIKSQNIKEPFESLYKLNIGHSLDEYEAEEAMSTILNEKDKEKRTILLTMLLNSIMIKGPTVNEISGLLTASLNMDNQLNENKKVLSLPKNEKLVGVASSGKKGIKTKEDVEKNRRQFKSNNTNNKELFEYDWLNDR